MAPPRMGMPSVRVRIFSADRTASEEMDLVLDSGSVFTWTARPVGDAPVECEGRRRTVGIAFGDPGDACVLGVTALERLGFAVDPRAQRLRRLDEQAALATA